MSEPRKLYRDTSNAVLGGVASGTAEYLNLDVTVARVLWVILIVVTGFFPGAVIYGAMWLLVPPKPQAPPPVVPAVQQS